ncbi:MAG: dihydroorotase [Phycisphaerae bacterium]
MNNPILLRGGRVIDPSQNMDTIADVAIENGVIVAIAKGLSGGGAATVVDCRERIVAPGLIDMHVHLREPGNEEKETIETGTAAAVAGGFTAVACMPNTTPPLDNDTQIEYVLRQARAAHCRVYPIGALTKARHGRELAEVGLMVKAGAVAFSDDGDGIADAGVCLRAMMYVGMFDKLIIQHCEDKTLAGKGCMNAGPTATRLGLPGIPALAEDVMAARDVQLARQAGVRYHVAHISTAGCVNVVRNAKRDGVKVTTEVCPHHLLLTEEACAAYDANFKMNPPLRSRADVEACLEGVRDGTIDCLITDHAPHTSSEKELGFQDAPNGIIGLETSLALFIKALVEPKLIDWSRLISAMSTRQAELLGVPGGTLKPGSIGDVTIIDPQLEWTIDAANMRSRSRNTPFGGWHVRGKAVGTIVGGEFRYREKI